MLKPFITETVIGDKINKIYSCQHRESTSKGAITECNTKLSIGEEVCPKCGTIIDWSDEINEDKSIIKCKNTSACKNYGLKCSICSQMYSDKFEVSNHWMNSILNGTCNSISSRIDLDSYLTTNISSRIDLDLYLTTNISYFIKNFEPIGEINIVELFNSANKIDET